MFNALKVVVGAHLCSWPLYFDIIKTVLNFLVSRRYSSPICIDGHVCHDGNRRLPFVVCRPRETNFRFPFPFAGKQIEFCRFLFPFAANKKKSPFSVGSVFPMCDCRFVCMWGCECGGVCACVCCVSNGNPGEFP